MGEFFKEEEAPPERKKREGSQLITTFNDLAAAYDALANKIQVLTNQGYEAMLPIRTRLSGTGKNIDDQGKVGMLRRRISGSRINRMDLGRDMWSVLDDVEDLNAWSEDYIEKLEESIDGLKVIVKSGFKIIKGYRDDIAKLETKISQYEDVIVAETGEGLKLPGEEEPEDVKLPKKKKSTRPKLL